MPRHRRRNLLKRSQKARRPGDRREPRGRLGSIENAKARAGRASYCVGTTPQSGSLPRPETRKARYRERYKKKPALRRAGEVLLPAKGRGLRLAGLSESPHEAGSLRSGYVWWGDISASTNKWYSGT